MLTGLVREWGTSMIVMGVNTILKNDLMLRIPTSLGPPGVLPLPGEKGNPLNTGKSKQVLFRPRISSKPLERQENKFYWSDSF